jgi:hypothetical protein
LLFGQEFAEKFSLRDDTNIIRVMEGTSDYGFNVALDEPRPAAAATATGAATPAATGAGRNLTVTGN